MSEELIQALIDSLKKNHTYTITNGDMAHALILEGLELLKEVKAKSAT